MKMNLWWVSSVGRLIKDEAHPLNRYIVQNEFYNAQKLIHSKLFNNFGWFDID